MCMVPFPFKKNEKNNKKRRFHRNCFTYTSYSLFYCPWNLKLYFPRRLVSTDKIKVSRSQSAIFPARLNSRRWPSSRAGVCVATISHQHFTVQDRFSSVWLGFASLSLHSLSPLSHDWLIQVHYRLAIHNVWTLRDTANKLLTRKLKATVSSCLCVYSILAAMLIVSLQFSLTD